MPSRPGGDNLYPYVPPTPPPPWGLSAAELDRWRADEWYVPPPPPSSSSATGEADELSDDEEDLFAESSDSSDALMDDPESGNSSEEMGEILLGAGPNEEA